MGREVGHVFVGPLGGGPGRSAGAERHSWVKFFTSGHSEPLLHPRRVHFNNYTQGFV